MGRRAKKAEIYRGGRRFLKKRDQRRAAKKIFFAALNYCHNFSTIAHYLYGTVFSPFFYKGNKDGAIFKKR